MVLICLIFSVLSTIEQYTGFANETLFWMVCVLLCLLPSLSLCRSVSLSVCVCVCLLAVRPISVVSGACDLSSVAPPGELCSVPSWIDCHCNVALPVAAAAAAAAVSLLNSHSRLASLTHAGCGLSLVRRALAPYNRQVCITDSVS